MNTDLKIAQAVEPKKIDLIAKTLHIGEDDLLPYGKDKAKVSLSVLAENKNKPKGKLILVTAMTPTPAGEGKTTVSIGLADGMRKIGLNTALALREPSLGPVFGIKGGAAGGGHSQVIPMTDINLHFTGDLHAITSANNLLCALIDNHIQHGNELNININNITMRRCMDINDRQLRNIVCGLGKAVDGVPREDGFDITAASEVMAILCMAGSLSDLKQRLNNITIGYNRSGDPVLAGDLNAGGAMAVLLKDALMPNLVQTLEHTPVLMHGGPFANIAHGCNSIIATHMAMCLADYTVTEAGFGADLGAEKFLDIKCRNADIWPNAVVLVATLRALKYHGGVKKENLNQPNSEALEKGFANLDRHIQNLKNIYGLNVVVAINRFVTDSPQEIDLLKQHLESMGAACAVCNSWEEGGAGAVELATTVQAALSSHTLPSHPYDYAQPIHTKISELAQKVYGAERVDFSSIADKKITLLEKQGYGNLPVCIAKTQYSFSDDPQKLGSPQGYAFTVRDVRLNSGAGFIVVLCGDIMRMPGLPKAPAAMQININESGNIEGLF